MGESIWHPLDVGGLKVWKTWGKQEELTLLLQADEAEQHINAQTLSVQLQVITVKSKPMLANKFISI